MVLRHGRQLLCVRQVGVLKVLLIIKRTFHMAHIQPKKQEDQNLPHHHVSDSLKVPLMTSVSQGAHAAPRPEARGGVRSESQPATPLTESAVDGERVL